MERTHGRCAEDRILLLHLLTIIIVIILITIIITNDNFGLTAEDEGLSLEALLARFLSPPMSPNVRKLRYRYTSHFAAIPLALYLTSRWTSAPHVT